MYVSSDEEDDRSIFRTINKSIQLKPSKYVKVICLNKIMWLQGIGVDCETTSLLEPVSVEEAVFVHGLRKMGGAKKEA
jgi:hypothetical protein